MANKKRNNIITKKGNYYYRIRWYNDSGRQVECTISLMTKDKSKAKARGRRVKKEVDDIKGMGFCYNSLGNISIEKGEAQDALSYYKQSLEIRNVLGNKHQIKETIDKMVFAYQDIGKNTLAKEYQTKSKTITKEIKSSEHI